MSEKLPVNMSSQDVLGLQAEGSEEAQRLIAIAALGMCHAVSARAVSPAYACHRLFGPALLVRLEQLGARPALQHAIHLATELEDVSDLVPDKLAAALQEIQDELVRVLMDLAPHDLAAEKWLAP